MEQGVRVTVLKPQKAKKATCSRRPMQWVCMGATTTRVIGRGRRRAGRGGGRVGTARARDGTAQQQTADAEMADAAADEQQAADIEMPDAEGTADQQAAHVAATGSTDATTAAAAISKSRLGPTPTAQPPRSTASMREAEARNWEEFHKGPGSTAVWLQHYLEHRDVRDVLMRHLQEMLISRCSTVDCPECGHMASQPFRNVEVLVVTSTGVLGLHVPRYTCR